MAADTTDDAAAVVATVCDRDPTDAAHSSRPCRASSEKQQQQHRRRPRVCSQNHRHDHRPTSNPTFFRPVPPQLPLLLHPPSSSSNRQPKKRSNRPQRSATPIPSTTIHTPTTTTGSPTTCRRPSTTTARRRRRRPPRCPKSMASASAVASATTTTIHTSSAEPQPQLHPPKAQPLPSKHKRRAAIASHRRRRWTQTLEAAAAAAQRRPSTYPLAGAVSPTHQYRTPPTHQPSATWEQSSTTRQESPTPTRQQSPNWNHSSTTGNQSLTTGHQTPTNGIQPPSNWAQSQAHYSLSRISPTRHQSPTWQLPTRPSPTQLSPIRQQQSRSPTTRHQHPYDQRPPQSQQPTKPPRLPTPPLSTQKEEEEEEEAQPPSQTTLNQSLTTTTTDGDDDDDDSFISSSASPSFRLPPPSESHRRSPIGQHHRRRSRIFTLSNVCWLLFMAVLCMTTSCSDPHHGVLADTSPTNHQQRPSGSPFATGGHPRAAAIEQDTDHHSIHRNHYNEIDEDDDNYNLIDDWTYDDDDHNDPSASYHGHPATPQAKWRPRQTPSSSAHKSRYAHPTDTPLTTGSSSTTTTTSISSRPSSAGTALDGVILASLGCPNCIYNLQFAAAVAAKQQQEQQSNPHRPTEPELDQRYFKSVTTPPPFDATVEDDDDEEAAATGTASPVGINAIRLEAIKHQILSKLGMSSKPTIRSDLPKRVVLETLSRAEQSSAIVRQMVLDEAGNAHFHHQAVHSYDAIHHGHHQPHPDRFGMAPSVTNRTATRRADHGDQDDDHDDTGSSSVVEVMGSSDPQSDSELTGGRHEPNVYYMYSSDADVVEANGGDHEYGRRVAGGGHRPEHQRPPGGHNDGYDRDRWPFDDGEQEEEAEKEEEDEPGAGEADDFFGQTREIITFADKGNLLNGHRLVEFATTTDQRRRTSSTATPFSGGAYGNDLHVRNAYVWVKMSLRSAASTSPPVNTLRGGQQHHSHTGNHVHGAAALGTITTASGKQQHSSKVAAAPPKPFRSGQRKAGGGKQHYHPEQKQAKHDGGTTSTTAGSAITLWVFRVIDPPPPLMDDDVGDDPTEGDESATGTPDMYMQLLADKEFDARTEIAGSKLVQLANVGWQRIDISATVRKWYAQSNDDTASFTSHHRRGGRGGRHAKPSQRLRLLIDCSGCGDRVTLHLFNTNSPLVPAPSPAAAAAAPSQPHQRQPNHPRHPPRPHPQPHHQHHPNRHRTPASPSPPPDANDPKPPPPPPSDAISRPFLVVFTEPSATGGAKRVRRRAVDCAGAAPRQCCKEKFYVDFRELGWDDWIIAPHGYYANYCRGDCSGPRSPDQFQSYHSHVLEEYRKMDRLSGLQPCCAPVKFSSMSLIYFEEDQKIVKRDLPKMVVDECGCP